MFNECLQSYMTHLKGLKYKNQKTKNICAAGKRKRGRPKKNAQTAKTVPEKTVKKSESICKNDDPVVENLKKESSAVKIIKDEAIGTSDKRSAKSNKVIKSKPVKAENVTKRQRGRPRKNPTPEKKKTLPKSKDTAKKSIKKVDDSKDAQKTKDDNDSKKDDDDIDFKKSDDDEEL